MSCECELNRKIGPAFMKAQAGLDAVEALATNPQFKNKYARLVDLYNASKKSLRENGIVIRHKCYVENDKQMIATILLHVESGEYYIDYRILVPEKPGCQGFGTAETYMKRYALKSLLATDVGEDDDDGEGERIYLARLSRLKEFIYRVEESFAKATDEAVCKHFKVKELKELGDGRLFDAIWFAMTFVIENRNNYKRLT